MADFSQLKTLKREIKEWQPLKPDDLRYGTVLAFDQSLGSASTKGSGTGWVWLVHQPQGVMIVRAGKMEPMDTGLVKGHGMSLLRSVDLYQQMVSLLGSARHDFDLEIVFETPPAGGKMARPESSLMAAEALCIACHVLGVKRPPFMVGAQPTKKTICGNSNAAKPEAHAALKGYYSWIAGSHLVTNEAHRDALMLALHHLKKD